jgi:hypothetical protein
MRSMDVESSSDDDDEPNKKKKKKKKNAVKIIKKGIKKFDLNSRSTQTMNSFYKVSLKKTTN